MSSKASLSFTDTWGYAMRVIMHSATQVLHERILTLDLSQPQWLIIIRLTIVGKTTAAHLARSMQLDATTTMRVIEKLEARGFITRTRSAVDRRVLDIELSPQGRKVARTIGREAQVVQEQILQGLSDSERTQWLALLANVQANSEKLSANLEPGLGN